MSEYLYLVTPVGRLVRGSVNERSAKDYDGNDYAPGTGPFEVGLAISKTDAATGEFLGKLYQKACTDAPNLKARIDAEWQSGFAGNNGGFKFKIRDGDRPNLKGVVNSNTVGHYVLNLSTTLPLKFTYTDQYGIKLTDPMGQPIPPRSDISPDHIKIGDYVHIALSTKYNGKIDGTAGLYLSQSAIMLAAYGEAISGGVSLDEAFADIPMGQLPAGASVAVPNGAAVATPPVTAGMPSLPTASPTNVQPHTEFLNAAPAPTGLPLPGQM